MGTLFPGDSEYPSHRPLPRVIKVHGRHVAVVGVLASLGTGFLVAGFDPAMLRTDLVVGDFEPARPADEHVPHQDFAETLRPAYSFAINSTTSSTGYSFIKRL